MTAKPQAKICLLSFRISFSKDHQTKINRFFEQQQVDCHFDLYSDLKPDQVSQS